MSDSQTLVSHGLIGSSEAGGLPTKVLETLVNRAYDRAKRWAGAGMILQVVLFGAGGVAIFWPAVTLSYPWIAVPLALVGAEIARRAGTYKGLAETAKRMNMFWVSGSSRHLGNWRTCGRVFKMNCRPRPMSCSKKESPTRATNRPDRAALLRISARVRGTPSI